jgi:hypothetical protein
MNSYSGHSEILTSPALNRLRELAQSLRHPLACGCLPAPHAYATLVLAAVRADHYGEIDSSNLLTVRDEILALAGVR